MANVSTYLQYGSAYNLKTLLNAIADNTTIDFDAWFRKYFDLRVCGKDGLVWWGEYLNQQQYITVKKLFKNITTNAFDATVFAEFYVPDNFNDGNWYNNQSGLAFFSDEEFRLILMNAWLKTYYGCTIGNLYEFLSNFFKRLPNMPFKDTQWEINTITRPNLPEFWEINYYPAFTGDSGKWEALFQEKKSNGDSLILPIPNDVEWKLQLLGAEN